MKDLLQTLQIAELRDWFYGLQPREKLYLLGGVAAFVLILVYFSLWQPLTASVARLNETVTQQQTDLAWMQTAASSIGQLQQQNSQRGGGNRSMLSAVDQAINTANLKGGLQRMEPDGQNSVKLWLIKSPFDEIVAMLGQLEQAQGIAIQTLAMTSSDGAGLVDARITLVRGGS
jgi:general secretion pathway protein M